MNLYLLSRNSSKPLYDAYYRFLVAALDAKSARQEAAKYAADEGSETWLNPSMSTIKQVKASNFQEPTIIVSDFNAG